MSSNVAADFFERIHERGVAQVVDSMSSEESIRLANKFGSHNYHPLPVNVARTEGSRVWSVDGKEYIDCIGAYSAVSHGHLNEFVTKTAIEQLSRQTLTSRAIHCPELGLFLEALCNYCELDRACPMNSGAEAVETCIKLARKWGYQVKGIPDNQAEILVADGNFHGRTTTIVGFSTEEGYKHQFGPFTPGFKVVKYNDLIAVENAINANTCAVLMEPIQAEGGVIVPHDGYMAGLRKICDKHNVLLIWDEIQTGFGRCGKRFAWQWEDAKPDLMSVGKALGGGIYPVSAAVGTEAVVGLFSPGDHGSTFGGNPLAAAVGLASLTEMVVQKYDEMAEVKGKLLRDGFQALQSSKIIDIRGRGLLIGLEVNANGEALTNAFLQEGLLTKETRKHTFRFAPPITTEVEQLKEVVARVGRAMNSL